MQVGQHIALERLHGEACRALKVGLRSGWMALRCILKGFRCALVGNLASDCGSVRIFIQVLKTGSEWLMRPRIFK